MRGDEAAMSTDSTNNPPLQPSTTILVCKHKGREVGRIAATAPNAEAYLTELARHYGLLEVDYERDENAWVYTAIRINQ